jgi:hypothetical protein
MFKQINKNNLFKKKKGEAGGGDPPYSTRLDLHPYRRKGGSHPFKFKCID